MTPKLPKLLLALLVSFSLWGCPAKKNPRPVPTADDPVTEVHRANGVPFDLYQDTKTLIIVFPRDRFPKASFIEVSFDNTYQGFFYPETKIYLPKPPIGVKRRLSFTPVDHLGQNISQSQSFNIP